LIKRSISLAPILQLTISRKLAFFAGIDSENPDHYKRSGATLHALYKSDVVASIEFDSSRHGTIEEVESARYWAGDSQQLIHFRMFYEPFPNQTLVFDLAYRLCCAYEPDPPRVRFRLSAMFVTMSIKQILSSRFLIKAIRSLMH
jgi:hypothetical protein